MATESQRARMLRGEPYCADDPDLTAARFAAARLCQRYNALPPEALEEGHAVLRQLLCELGEGVEIRAPLYCDYGSQLRVGARTFVNFGLVALDCAPITLGEDVQVGPNVQLLAATHPLAPAQRRAKWEMARPIAIGDNVWIGGGAIVLPGVTIGANTVVGAGAVVTRDLPADVVAVGNPARVIKRLGEG